jgi:hypothetical protein
MTFFDRLQFFTHRSFAAFSRGGPVRVAVIGNGGLSPEDQAIIDEADCIIRFNNYATRDGIQYSADRFQCDMLWTTGDLHSEGAEPRAVVLGIPFPFKCEEMPRRIEKWYGGCTAYMVNPYWNLKMNQELKTGTQGWKHPFPSIGFTCLWHIYNLFIKVPNFKASVFIAGFNWYWDEDTKRIQKWDMTREDYPNVWNHNYPREVRWIIEKLLDHPQFSFSESCWRILMTVKKQIGK